MLTVEDVVVGLRRGGAGVTDRERSDLLRLTDLFAGSAAPEARRLGRTVSALPGDRSLEGLDLSAVGLNQAAVRLWERFGPSLPEDVRPEIEVHADDMLGPRALADVAEDVVRLLVAHRVPTRAEDRARIAALLAADDRPRTRLWALRRLGQPAPDPLDEAHARRLDQALAVGDEASWARLLRRARLYLPVQPSTQGPADHVVPSGRSARQRPPGLPEPDGQDTVVAFTSAQRYADASAGTVPAYDVRPAAELTRRRPAPTLVLDPGSVAAVTVPLGRLDDLEAGRVSLAETTSQAHTAPSGGPAAQEAFDADDLLARADEALRRFAETPPFPARSVDEEGFATLAGDDPSVRPTAGAAAAGAPRRVVRLVRQGLMDHRLTVGLLAVALAGWFLAPAPLGDYWAPLAFVTVAAVRGVLGRATRTATAAVTTYRAPVWVAPPRRWPSRPGTPWSAPSARRSTRAASSPSRASWRRSARRSRTSAFT